MAKPKTVEPDVGHDVGLPDVVWITLGNALAWLATGRLVSLCESPRPANHRQLIGAVNAAWAFLREGGRAGKVTLSGVPWDTRLGLSMSRKVGVPSSGHKRLSDKAEDIDSRCFSKRINWSPATGEDAICHDEYRGLRFRGPRNQGWVAIDTQNHDWPYAATAWSAVHIRREELLRYARDSEWKPILDAIGSGDQVADMLLVVEAQDASNSTAVSPPPDRRQTLHAVNPTIEDKLRRTHNLLGRRARQLRKKGLSNRAIAESLTNDPVNNSCGKYAYDTLRKMLGGKYDLFIKLGLGPLGE